MASSSNLEHANWTSHFRVLNLVALLLFLGAPTAAVECVVGGDTTALQVTADCVDPLFNSPVIDAQVDESSPVPHRRVSGHFDGTEIDFNIYLPDKADWGGRFFQLSYPLQNSTADDETIAFGADSSAYTIQATGMLGYRADAALAKFSREVARDYYQEPSRQIYGYLYGGSGGSFTTIGAIENTFRVWDGAVGLVQATPISQPNTWCIRMLGGLVLTDNKAKIIDAVSPGGSGDPTAGLSEVERTVLDEGAALGIPIKSMEDYDGVFQNRTLWHSTGLWTFFQSQTIPLIKTFDPTYERDFWTQPGYLGTEKSALGNFFRQSLVNFNATVTNVVPGATGIPTTINLDKVPSIKDLKGLEFYFQTKDGNQGSFGGVIDLMTNQVSIEAGSNTTVLDALTEGTQVQVNNKWYLAAHSYHRHQVPPLEEGYYAWDYLRNADGEPRYPQRNAILSPRISQLASGGGRHTGNITGKVIVMDNLMDYDALPWHADWYKGRVKKALGDRFSDNYRLHYSDNADHQMHPVPQELSNQIVDFRPIYHQHLRDLSAWVEKGTLPPKETSYTVENGQVIVPETAASRGGIQPVVTLTVGDSKSVKVKEGEAVNFAVHVETPPGTGSVVSIEWDFKGTGEYVEGELAEVSPEVDDNITYKYDEAGVYLPAVRVASQRDGDTKMPFTRVMNLDRVRITVGDGNAKL